MNRIRIISNNSNKTNVIKRKVIELIKRHKLIIDESNPELIIAIGGDGTFLKALKETEYNSNITYIGVNTGHLGFLQDIKCEELDDLFKSLCNKSYIVDTISLADISFQFGKNNISYKALNEFIIREQDLKVLKVEIKLNNSHLEDFNGDGLLISTPVGSTAHNLSLGGSIIYHSIESLQLKPIAPLPTSKHFSNLSNSIILPKDIEIEIIPKSFYKKKILSIIDGEKLIFGIDIDNIKIKLSDTPIKILRTKPYDLCAKINEKFIDFV